MSSTHVFECPACRGMLEIRVPESDIPEIPLHRGRIVLGNTLHTYDCPMSLMALKPIRNVMIFVCGAAHSSADGGPSCARTCDLLVGHSSPHGCRDCSPDTRCKSRCCTIHRDDHNSGRTCDLPSGHAKPAVGFHSCPACRGEIGT